ncbi:MAG TPA: GatB/YqeY domain-containing protein [Pseudonocardiaceae bacterium]|nr:GatB/YqeY domain-containing protein [Pseudonocardiaceae bacterium]
MGRLQERMKADLTAALRDRDRPAVTALRTALAAIANAEAVPSDNRYQHPVVGQLNEVPRRELAEEQVEAVLRAEAAERQQAIEEYESLGLADAAARLRAEQAALTRYLG